MGLIGKKKRVLSIGKAPVLRADDVKTEVADHLSHKKALTPPWLLPDHEYDEIYAPYLFCRTQDPRPILAEFYRVAKNGCLLELTVPAGSADEAWMNPDYVRPYYPNSFLYYQRSMMEEGEEWAYDWACRAVYLRVPDTLLGTIPEKEHLRVAMMSRNVCTEICAVLECIRPMGKVGSMKELKLPRIFVQPLSGRIA